MKHSRVPSKKVSTLLARSRALLPWYDLQILEQVDQQGGFFNAHAHIDRAETLPEEYLQHYGTNPLDASSWPLSVKQNLVGTLHLGKGYTKEDLEERMSRVIERQIAFGTTRLDTNIDATPDLPEDGLLAINVALKLKKKYEGRIAIRIAPTPIFGFKHDPRDKLGRWKVFKAAAELCDYISLLPEKDDFDQESRRDGKIGFKHHIRKGIELACTLKKEVQFHLDQTNTASERGTEQFLELIEGLELPFMASGGPAAWIIHFISPSVYGEQRFARIVRWLLRLNIGIIVCPSAALSMRQLRSLDGPIHNSIARVLELIKMKVPIRLGTDNINDTFVPASDGDMLTEIKMAAQATRLYHPSIWAKLASGMPLNNVDIATVGRVLYEDRKACREVNPGWEPAFE